MHGQGVTVFARSASGLGGGTYARLAYGDVASEDVMYVLRGMGVDTGIDPDLLLEASLYVSEQLSRPPRSKVARAMLGQKDCKR